MRHDHGRGADAGRRPPPDAPVRGPGRLPQPLPADHEGPRGTRERRRPDTAPRRVPGSRMSSATPRGSSACRAARATGAVAARVERGEHAGGRRVRRRLLARVRAGALPGRAPAPVRRARPPSQPPAGAARRAGRGPLRRHRQRPLPRVGAHAAPGRSRRRPPPHHARQLRARERRPNAQFFLRSAEEMAALFAGYPEALTTTLRIAERLRFNLDARPRLPLPVRRRRNARRPPASSAGRRSAAARREQPRGGDERALDEELA